MNKYKTFGTTYLFSEDYRLDKLSKQGDPLERLNKVVNWEYFRETIEKIHNKKMVNAGPKPYDPLLMFKILILQRYYNLSDAQIEYQILDRLTFCRFLGLSLNDKVPDEKTVWDFRNKLIFKGHYFITPALDEMIELILFRDRRLQYLRVQSETENKAIAS